MVYIFDFGVVFNILEKVLVLIVLQIDHTLKNGLIFLNLLSLNLLIGLG